MTGLKWGQVTGDCLKSFVYLVHFLDHAVRNIDSGISIISPCALAIIKYEEKLFLFRNGLNDIVNLFGEDSSQLPLLGLNLTFKLFGLSLILSSLFIEGLFLVLSRLRA